MLGSNKSKELDNDIECEESKNVGKPEDIHVSTKLSNNDKNYEDDCKKNITYDGLDDVKGETLLGSVQPNSSIKSSGSTLLNKPKGVKGQHESKFASCLGNKRKVDEQTEAKLGKKRNRQTMFLNLEDVKRAGTLKTPTSKRKSSVQSPSTHFPRENHRSSHALSDGSVDKQGLLNNKDQRQADSSSSEKLYETTCHEFKIRVSTVDDRIWPFCCLRLPSAILRLFFLPSADIPSMTLPRLNWWAPDRNAPNVGVHSAQTHYDPDSVSACHPRPSALIHNNGITLSSEPLSATTSTYLNNRTQNDVREVTKGHMKRCIIGRMKRCNSRRV